MCGYGDVTAVGYGDACDKDGSQGEGQGMTSSILEQGEEAQEQLSDEQYRKGGKVLVAAFAAGTITARPAATLSRLSSTSGSSRILELSASSRCSPSSRSRTLSQVQAFRHKVSTRVLWTRVTRVLSTIVSTRVLETRVLEIMATIATVIVSSDQEKSTFAFSWTRMASLSD
jgi:hypothetical protein